MVPLVESRLARHLTEPIRALLVAGVHRRTYAAGERVFEEGSPGDGLYVLESGLVEIAARSVPGRQHRLAVMEPGEYFGEMAVFDGGARSASAIALEESVLQFVPTPLLQKLLEHSPMLAAALVRDSSLRMRDFNRRFLQELLKAERLSLVERLARTIVHDFRNPLNVIGIAADLAAEPSATLESRRSARDRVRRQVEVLNRMMQELLDFTRGMTPSAVLPKVDFVDFVREMVFELEPEASRRGVGLDADLGPLKEGPLLVRMDALRMQRVFNNLFQNAFDAVGALDDAILRMRFEVNDREVVIEVSDNGPGIPAVVLPHVFQPFVTFGKAHGTGLGLAICDRIVAEHGGKMSVVNQPDSGACFRFGLPRARPGDTDPSIGKP
jgi:signal transduction histidine kinase